MVQMLHKRSGLLFRIYRKLRYRWPIYDVLAYFKNRESSRLYRRDRIRMVPRPAEHKVIDDLRRDGISVVPVTALLPAVVFDQAQEWAERLIEDKTVREWIEQVRIGERTTSTKGGKFYIIRPLGDLPALDTSDAVIAISLSDPVLRIVSSYLGMFPS